MSAIADIWRAIAERVRAVRQDWCRHNWQPEGEPFVRPGRKWRTAEQLYRCRKCGATRQEGIF
jgi:hypothetical protein